MATRVTTDDLLAAIDALGKEQPKRPPGKMGKGGWQTVGEMAKEKGISRSAMNQRFRVAMEKGLKVERFVGSDYNETGTLVKQTWFKVKR